MYVLSEYVLMLAESTADAFLQRLFGNLSDSTGSLWVWLNPLSLTYVLHNRVKPLMYGHVRFNKDRLFGGIVGDS